MSKLIKPFKTQPRKSGNSHVLTIPAWMFRADIVDPTAEYKVTLEKLKK